MECSIPTAIKYINNFSLNIYRNSRAVRKDFF